MTAGRGRVRTGQLFLERLLEIGIGSRIQTGNGKLDSLAGHIAVDANWNTEIDFWQMGFANFT